MKNYYPFCIVKVVIAVAICSANLFTTSAQFNNSTLAAKLWEHTTGTPDTIDWSSSALDGSGNLIVVGNTMVTTNNTDMLITKYATDGTVLWQVQYDHTNNNRDYGVAVAIDASDDIYVAGTSIVSSGNGYDWVIQKYDDGGTLVWEEQYNGPGSSYDVPTDMVLDGAGALYVVGASYGTTSLSDYCTRKYSASNGTFIWEARYDYTSLLDIPAAITLGSSARVYVTGGSASSFSNWDFATVKYNATTGAQITVTRNSSSGLGLDHPTALAKDQYDNIYVTGAATNGTHYDIKTVKFDEELNTVWSVTWDNVGLDDQANSIGVDVNGYVYLTGYTNKTNSGSDFITIKYNSNGTVQWEKFYSAPDETKTATARKLDIAPYGDILVTGDVYNIGNKDFLTLAYDESGNVKWQEWFTGIGNGDDTPMAIKAGVNNLLFVTGRVWTGTQYSYLTVKYEMIDYITPPDNESCPASFAYFKNKGQIIGTDATVQPNVKFHTLGYAPTAYMLNSKIAYAFSNIDAQPATTDTILRVDLSFYNSLDTKPYHISPHIANYLNYYKPWCGSGIVGVNGYQRLLYPEIYNNVDAMFYGNDAGIKYYFICNVGSRPSDIVLKFSGADLVEILGNGHLKIHTMLGVFEQESPTAFQIDAAGNIISLNWQPTYTSLGNNKFSFNKGSYDSNKPLIITLRRVSGTPCTSTSNGNQDWGTFYGNQEDDLALDQCNNPVGDLFVVGTTESEFFPVQNNVQAQFNGINDGFVIKFDQYAVRQWATLYGGSNYDAVQSVMYNANLGSNNLFICGSTLSTDLITTSAGQANEYYKNSNSGGRDGFITQFNSVFGTIYYSTYFGGSGDDEARSIVPGGEGGNLIVGGNTTTTLVSNNLCAVPTNSGFPLCNPTGTLDYYQDHNAGG